METDTMKKDDCTAQEDTRVCRCCKRELPLTSFEKYKTGTRRHVCNRCKYLLYTVPAQRRYQLRQVEMRFEKGI